LGLETVDLKLIASGHPSTHSHSITGGTNKMMITIDYNSTVAVQQDHYIAKFFETDTHTLDFPMGKMT